jgi:glutaredoxin
MNAIPMRRAQTRRMSVATVAAGWPLVAALLAALLGSADAWAQYKVVGPDGKVTYTDRAPPSVDGKVKTLNARAAAGTPEVALPTELRQVVARYPATLYVTAVACAPCDAARQLLRQRGVPYSEKVVVTSEDGDALERTTGGRDAPTLTLGGQTLRGLSSELWGSYLDAAGYPRESRLPANYRNPEPTPLTKPREAPAPRAAAAPAPAAEPEVTEVPPAPGGFKF